MLVSEPMVMRHDPILNMIAKGFKTIELQTGIYQVGHFGCSDFLLGYEEYPKFCNNKSSYGVCDNIENLLQVYMELQHSDRQFVVTLKEVKKSEQSSDGGWRWRKWGEYIGSQEPTCEYLYDEPLIESVFFYRIYEWV